MEFDVQLELARLNRNTRHVALRRIWKLLVFLSALLFFGPVIEFGLPWGALIGGISVVVVLGVVYALVMRRYSRANATWLRMSGGVIHIAVTEDWLEVEHETTRSQIRWWGLGPIIKLREDWILMMHTGGSYVPLPLDQVPEDALISIEAEVIAHADERDRRSRP
ncbi:MAG: hypothetical protein GF393_12665 [Armatimonadia bacterium]|nr:hypothetical protein [Armatimonadia bacterium]